MRTVLHGLGHLVGDVVEEVAVLNENVLRLWPRRTSDTQGRRCISVCACLFFRVWVCACVYILFAFVSYVSACLCALRARRTWNMVLTATFDSGLANTIPWICAVRKRRMFAQSVPAEVATAKR